MGEVYRARDTRLGRDVAVKVLPSEMASDPARRQRFEQEARAASALNHPNIVAVYDIGIENGTFFIVSELVQGESLRVVIRRGPVSVRRSVDIAMQLADALAAAHSAGIVHRDLKPENIMVNPAGSGTWRVKLLDFGLARQVPLVKVAGDGATVTDPGTVMGTAPYMSPEQVRGQIADHRSDIFSFGVVLYEMLSGRSVFSRETAPETMHAILKDDQPDLAGPGRQIPFALEKIVRHCLEKGPNERFQSAWDLALALEATSAQSQLQPPQAIDGARLSKRPFVAFLALGCFVLGGLITFLALAGRLADRGKHVSVNHAAFTQVTDDSGPELDPSLSPDEKSVVYASKASGNWNIYVRTLGTRDSVNLTKNSERDDIQPAFSPDGKWIAFRSEREGGGIYFMNALGEGVKRLSDTGFNPAWSPDGKQILFADESISHPEDRSVATSRLWSVVVSTGEKRLLSKGDAVQPQWSPHGHRIAYWAIDRGGHRDIWTIPAQGGQPLAVTHDEHVDWAPVWSPDGAYLYFSSDRGGSMAIWRVPLLETSGKVLGPPEPVPAPAQYISHLNFSRDGRRLAYVNETLQTTIQRIQFDPVRETIIDEPKELTDPSKAASRPAVSPDGEWLAFNSSGKQDDIFVMRTNGAGLRQLTDDVYKNRGPRWSPDGKRIAFFSKRSKNSEIWTIHPDGSGLEQVTNYSGGTVAWPVWSPDGKSLAYTVFGLGSFIMDPAKEWIKQAPSPLPTYGERGHLFSAWSWSPDGGSIAGLEQRADGSYAGIVVYSVGSRTFEKLTDFGVDPVWLGDGRRLLFLHEGKIHLVDRQSKKTRELLSVAPQEIARRGFVVSRDDRQICFSMASLEADIWLMNLE
jgi:Tol biopolymer transport system component